METFNNIEIKLTPLQDIFSDDDVEILKMIVEKDYCHYNAFVIANLFEIKYCEGYYLDKDGCIVSHAFNKMGDKYFDVSTAKYYPYVERVYLKREFSSDEITKIFLCENNCFITF